MVAQVFYCCGVIRKVAATEQTAVARKDQTNIGAQFAGLDRLTLQFQRVALPKPILRWLTEPDSGGDINQDFVMECSRDGRGQASRVVVNTGENDVRALARGDGLPGREAGGNSRQPPMACGIDVPDGGGEFVNFEHTAF